MRIPKDIRRLIILSPGKLPPGLGERLLLLRIRNATANNRHSSLLFAESEQHQPRNKSIFRVCLCSALHLSRLDKTVVTVTVHTNGNIIGCWRNENVNLNQSSFARSTFTFPELRIYPPTKSACAFFAGTQHTRRCEVNALLFLLLLQRRFLPTSAAAAAASIAVGLLQIWNMHEPLLFPLPCHCCCWGPTFPQSITFKNANLSPTRPFFCYSTSSLFNEVTYCFE